MSHCKGFTIEHPHFKSFEHYLYSPDIPISHTVRIGLSCAVVIMIDDCENFDIVK